MWGKTAAPRDPTVPQTAADKPELIVLLHGIGSTRWLMWPLARRLQREGYVTRLWGYFSLRGSNRDIGRRLASELNRLAASGAYSRVHVVAHSMGSIAMRCAFEESLPTGIGRVVMIAPPNRGSHAATRLTRLRGLLSPTLYELRDTPDSFVNSLPAAPGHAEVGVIATRLDRVVSLECTHLDGQRDHCLVEGMHTAALWTSECAQQVAQFLRHGQFLRAEAAPAGRPVGSAAASG